MPSFTKKSRPSFSAPKPPIPPEVSELVENEKPDKPEPVTTEVVKPTVSHTKNPQRESPLEATLKEVIPPEETPEPEPEPSLPVETHDAVVKESSHRASNKPSPDRKADAGFIQGMIVVFALILSVSGWLMYFKEIGGVNLNLNFLSQTPPEPTPTPQPASEPEAAPTPDPRSTIYLDVLNGSGVAGAAGRTADTLRTLGYQIAEVGNASSQNYTETEIYTAENFTQESLLISDLLDTFDTATISGLLEDASSTASARIIVGKDWEE